MTGPLLYRSIPALPPKPGGFDQGWLSGGGLRLANDWRVSNFGKEGDRLNQGILVSHKLNLSLSQTLFDCVSAHSGVRDKHGLNAIGCAE